MMNDQYQQQVSCEQLQQIRARQLWQHKIKLYVIKKPGIFVATILIVLAAFSAPLLFSTVRPSHAMSSASSVVGGIPWAWGDNDAGALGITTTGNCNGNPCSTTPEQISNLTNIVTLSGGNSDTLALKSDGTVWSWGYNQFGEIGNGTASLSIPNPVQVTGLANVTAIAAGFEHSLAVKTDGTVWAWGDDAGGEL